MIDPKDLDDVLEIESLDLEGQGVARRPDGKVVFVEGALPGERVAVQVTRRKAQWEQAVAVSVMRESAQRVRPRCPHFGLHAGACGGCKLQHLDPAAQVAVKQRVLEDNLWHLAKVKPQQMLSPLHGPSWGYRHRARLSVRHVQKKGTVLVGFHERKSRYVADMGRCEVLPAALSALLLPLRALISALDARDRVPQIEVAVGDAQTALVLRHLHPLSDGDLARLRQFAHHHQIRWWLQSGGPATAQPLEGDGDDLITLAPLAYGLPEFGLRMPFGPTDFTQVNAQVNASLVRRAVRLLNPRPGDRVIDWFCGLGNFSLPIARRSGDVLGVEGSRSLVERAVHNARQQGLADQAEFVARDIFQVDAAALLALGPAQRWLIDPPREGAFALVKAVSDLAQDATTRELPLRIVYVSCNPSTLARDAGLLVHRAGYVLTQAGVLNMFPHTAHVESLAVFDRPLK